MQTGITGPPVGHQGEEHALFQGSDDIALRLKHLSRRKVGSVAEQVNAGRSVQLPLMMKPGPERAGFGLRLRAGVITCVTIRRCVAVMLSGGDRVVTHADRRIHRCGGCPVVIIPRGDRAGGKGVPGSYIPDRLCRTVKQTRRLAVGQAHIKLVVELAVGQYVRIQTAHVVHHRTPVNPHFRQNAPDKLKVRFPPLGDNFTRRVGALQAEFKIGSLQPVFAQYLLHHLRN
ncbi:Uncharacterised protein [Enterobacter ludwigii]|nr:Uncharacterised protein [Enterobacter ludwigii]